MKKLLYLSLALLSFLFVFSSCENKDSEDDACHLLDGTTWVSNENIGTDTFVFDNGSVKWTNKSEFGKASYTYNYKIKASTIWIGYDFPGAPIEEHWMFRGKINEELTEMTLYENGVGTPFAVHRQK